MTDRYAGFIVSLEQDLREDDAQATLAAIRQIRGVIDVQPVQGGFEIQIAQNRVRLDLGRKLRAALYGPLYDHTEPD